MPEGPSKILFYRPSSQPLPPLFWACFGPLVWYYPHFRSAHETLQIRRRSQLQRPSGAGDRAFTPPGERVENPRVFLVFPRGALTVAVGLCAAVHGSRRAPQALNLPPQPRTPLPTALISFSALDLQPAGHSFSTVTVVLYEDEEESLLFS